MGIDTAFLVGVLVGQWIMLFVLGRMISRMARLIMIFETIVDKENWTRKRAKIRW
jgi:hypothetical protein